MRKGIAMLLCLAMLLGLVPSAVAAEPSGWRLLDSQQNGAEFEVWFATDEQISGSKLIYQYGGVDLPGREPSTMESVGYIFVVDTTRFYDAAKEKDPREIIRNAVSNMSDYDMVAFVGVTESNLGLPTAFDFKNNWEREYNKIYENTGSPSSIEYAWDALSKAISFAQASYQNRTVHEMVIIQITDGNNRGKSKNSETCLAELTALPFELPYYCIYLTNVKKKTNEFITFSTNVPIGGLKAVSNSNAANVAAECVLPYSHLIYKSILTLGPEVWQATSQTLTISTAGSRNGLTQDNIVLDMSQVPTATPEPTATPSPTPTPELNPQFVGPDSGSEHDIWELQRTLITLGFLNAESPSGYWDSETSIAVNRYYNLNGIGSDRIPTRGGMVKEIYDELMLHPENVITPTPAPTDTPTPEPTPEPTIDPVKGVYIGYDTEQRSLIHSLNKALKERYYLDENVDGASYSDATQNAVDEFYRDYPELSRPEGEVGISKMAYEALLQAAPRVTATPEPTVTPDPNPAYISYSTDNQNLAAELNQALIRKFLVEDESRITMDRYNDETDNAVEAFYRYCLEELGLSTDQIPRPSEGRGITEKAYKYLLGMEPRPTATPVPGLKYEINSEGLKSNDALVTAKQLADLGYLQETEGTVDESAFRSAVAWFAERNQIPAPEDYITDEFYQSVMSEDARPSEDPPEELIPGKKEPLEQIVNFQDALQKLDYYRDIQEPFKRGTFDEPTRKAYTRFCEVNGIAYEGGNVSWEDQQKVLTATEKNPELDLFEKTKTFVMGSYELFGFSVPVWALLAAALLVVIAIVVVIVVLVKKRKGGISGDSYSTGYSGETTFTMTHDHVNVAEDAKTEDFGESVNVGLDAATVNPEDDCVLSLMITNGNGISRDATYNLREGEQLVIGRGSTADITMDTEDRTISRTHGVFTYAGRIVSYRDTSSHYSLVDGEQIHQETRPLHLDSQIQMGKSIIKVRWS